MTPEGPFTSPWTDTAHFLVRTIRGSDVVFAIVPNGTQPADASLIFPKIRDARSWLTDNGFKKES